MPKKYSPLDVYAYKEKGKPPFHELGRMNSYS